MSDRCQTLQLGSSRRSIVETLKAVQEQPSAQATLLLLRGEGLATATGPLRIRVDEDKFRPAKYIYPM
jgi:hypothetical protein